MKLQVEIKLVSDGDEVVLAHESAHVGTLTDTQRAMCRKVAHAAADLLAGEKVLGKPLIEHLVD